MPGAIGAPRRDSGKVAQVARILRLRGVLDKTGDTRSPHYVKMGKGLFTLSVKLGGPRAVGWPEEEVDAIVNARIAGHNDDQIRKLVQRLHEQRKSAAALVKA
jgi:prophage regulatory protein